MALAGRARRSRIDKPEMISNNETIFATVEIQTGQPSTTVTSGLEIVELGRLGVGGAGHAGELLVNAEVVLVADGRQRLVLFLDLDAFLGFDRLVQAVRPAAARHLAAGELVDDQDLTFLDQVVDVALVQRMRAQRLRHVVQPLDVLGVVQVADAQTLLDALNPAVGHNRRVRLLVDGVVDVLAQRRDHRVDLLVQVGRLLGRARDDERRARLVDQDISPPHR